MPKEAERPAERGRVFPKKVFLYFDYYRFRDEQFFWQCSEDRSVLQRVLLFLPPFVKKHKISGNCRKLEKIHDFFAGKKKSTIIRNYLTESLIT